MHTISTRATQRREPPRRMWVTQVELAAPSFSSAVRTLSQSS